jgi:hypothetical protein
MGGSIAHAVKLFDLKRLRRIGDRGSGGHAARALIRT